MDVTDAPALDQAPAKARAVEELIERIRAGEIDAFEEIIRLYERRVLSMAIQMGLTPQDSQDAAQEVFLRVFRYLAKFDPGRSFEAWIWKICVNVVFNSLRRRRDRGEVSWEALVGEGMEEPAHAEALQLQVENTQLCSHLLSHMGVLSRQERMVFVLRELQELETAEVARAMRISAITVRRHAASARGKLRHAMEAGEPRPDKLFTKK